MIEGLELQASSLPFHPARPSGLYSNGASFFCVRNNFQQIGMHPARVLKISCLFISQVQFHHEYPWIVSSSDDQTVRSQQLISFVGLLAFFDRCKVVQDLELANSKLRVCSHWTQSLRHVRSGEMQLNLCSMWFCCGGCGFVADNRNWNFAVSSKGRSDSVRFAGSGINFSILGSVCSYWILIRDFW